MYELPPFNIGAVYSRVLNIVLTTVFYAPLIPIGLLYTCIGLFLFFWIQKFFLVKRRSVNVNVSYKIVLEMIILLEMLLPLYCISNIIWEIFLIRNAYISYYAICGVVIGIIHAFLPMETISKHLTEHSDEVQELSPSYYQAFKDFETDYNI